MLYDTIAQSFITLKTLATYQGYGVDDNHRKFIHYAKQFGASSITGIYKLSEYDKIPDKFKEQMNNAVNESNNIRAIKAHTMSDDELSAFYTAPGAFDKDGDLNMCSFADQIQIIARDVKSIIKPGLVPAIVSLGLAKPFSKSIYEVSDNQNFTLNGTLKFEDDAHTEIVEYKFYKEDCVMYLIGEITKDTNINKRGVLNESVCSLMNIATALYCIGKYRKDIGDTLEPYNGITNDKVEPDRFHFLRSQSYSSRGRVKISLALDKLNCDPYLIGEVFDTDFYTLLRFKTIRDAMDFFDKAVLQYTDIHYGWSNLVNGIANGITMSDSDTLVARPRSLILRGLPNGYPTVEDSLGIFDILAKQPNNKI
jgi:hypothetical protein